MGLLSQLLFWVISVSLTTDYERFTRDTGCLCLILILCVLLFFCLFTNSSFYLYFCQFSVSVPLFFPIYRFKSPFEFLQDYGPRKMHFKALSTALSINIFNT